MDQISVGTYTVHLLHADQKFADPDWQEKLPEDVRKTANTYRSAARKAEYLRSRYFAMILGTPIIGAGESGEPLWEDGVTASLTHKQGRIGIVYGLPGETRAIGLDLEIVPKVKWDFASKICTAADLAQLNNLQESDRQRFLACLFCGKEALFKCHFPLGQKHFYFHDAELETLDENQGMLALKVSMDTSPLTPRGSVTFGYFRFIEWGGVDHVLSVMAL